MLDKIIKSLEPFQEFFHSKFQQDNEEAVEILLMLAYGHMFEIFTPNQLAEVLGIDKNRVYGAIKSWSVFQFRRMFLLAGYQEVCRLLKDVLTKSPATLSRMRITLSVDDTVVDRQGKLISLTYSWFSGRHKDIVKGQNIITISIKIGDRIIPLCIRPVSKQGRGNTSKPEIFSRLTFHQIKNYAKRQSNLCSFFREHFHLCAIPQRL